MATQLPFCGKLPRLYVLLLLAVWPFATYEAYAAPKSSGKKPDVQEVSQGEAKLDAGKPETGTSESAKWGPADLETIFYRAIAAFQKNDLSGASVAFEELRATSRKARYQNLSAFSQELIRQASLLSADRSKAEIRFLIHQAIELSPSDGRIYISSSTFTPALGWAQSISYLIEGLTYCFRYPTAVASVGMNILLVILVAVSCAFFVMCVIQIVCNGEHLLVSFGKSIPVRSRGILAPVGLLIVLSAPLWWGIFIAMACWALLLSCHLRSCRWALSLAGVIFLCWGIGAELIHDVGTNLKGGSNDVLEDLNQRSFSSNANETLQKAWTERPKDPIYPYFLAMLAEHRGEYRKAEELYHVSLGSPLSGPSFRSAVYMNLGALSIVQNRFEDARRMLLEAEKLGESGFELWYNLATACAGLTDMEGYRKYYGLAVEFDKVRMDALTLVKSAEPMFLQLPSHVLYLTLLRRNSTDSVAFAGKEKLLANLIPSGSSTLLIGLGGVLVLVGLFVRFSQSLARAREFVRYVYESKKPTTVVWALLPGGFDLAGDRPLSGLVVLTVVLALVISAFEKPVELFSFIPFATPSVEFLELVAAIIFLTANLPPLIRSVRMQKRATVPIQKGDS